MNLPESTVLEALATAAERLLGQLDSSAHVRFERYREDPVGFARDVMGIEPWSRQAELLEAAALHDRVLCRSGHKVGKSLSAVILALWFVATRPGARVMMTAPTSDQVKKILWRELRLWYPKIATDLDGPADPALDPHTGVQLSGGREIFGRTANKPEGLAGVSGPALLFIVDEASGFEDPYYEAIKGNCAGGTGDAHHRAAAALELAHRGSAEERARARELLEQHAPAGGEARIVAFSNPTRPSGWFYEGFRNGLWHCIHISSEESPNITCPDAAPIPGLATQAYIDEQRAECGAGYAEHPIYQVRVEGNFPSAGPNAVIGLALVEGARKRWDEHVRAHPHAGLSIPELARLVASGRAIVDGVHGALELGVDPKRFGDDDCVITARRGPWLYRPITLSGALDGDAIAEPVVQAVRTLRRRARDTGPTPVKVDGKGNGAAVVDALRRHEASHRGELVVVDVDVSEAATDEKYVNVRSQHWFGGATWLAEGGALPPEARLTQELLVATFGFDTRNRLKVASKDEMRKVLKRSPNHADAMLLACWAAPFVPLRVESQLPEDREPVPRF